MKLRRYDHVEYHEGKGFEHWCPACQSLHAFAVEEPNASNAQWNFNGDMENPTFEPSMNRRIGPMPTVPVGRPDAGKIHVCHYFLRNGQIQFLGDCTHAMAGQTVPLPDIPGRYAR